MLGLVYKINIEVLWREERVNFGQTKERDKLRHCYLVRSMFCHFELNERYFECECIVVVSSVVDIDVIVSVSNYKCWKEKYIEKDDDDEQNRTDDDDDDDDDDEEEEEEEDEEEGKLDNWAAETNAHTINCWRWSLNYVH